jgi:hypothetical protein
MTSAFHPQADGQSEAANKVITMYLRCLTGDRPRQWLRWLPWAEYVYNTAFQASLRDTPFKIVYGRDPPSIRSYEPGETRVAAVAKSMAERDELLADARCRLEQAQAVYKRHYDKNHREARYAVGDWVWLRLRHRAPASLQGAPKGKLRPRFYGPYRVAAIINDVAYRLELPPRARLHDVFHIGLLKQFVGTPPAVPPALPPTHHGATQPVRDARCWFIGRGNQQHLLPGKTSTASSTDILHSSSRTSCSSRGGEMSCGADNTAAGLEHEVQQGLPPWLQTSRSPRRLRRLGVSAIKK